MEHSRNKCGIRTCSEKIALFLNWFFQSQNTLEFRTSGNVIIETLVVMVPIKSLMRDTQGTKVFPYAVKLFLDAVHIEFAEQERIILRFNLDSGCGNGVGQEAVAFFYHNAAFNGIREFRNFLHRKRPGESEFEHGSFRSGFADVLVGDSGTGKTFIASGLIHEAVKAGYKAYLLTLEELFVCLKTKEISRPAMKTYKRIMKAQLLAIDDVTLFPLKGEDVLLLFKLVNCVQGKTSLIITASRDLTGWLEMAGDEVCAAALLDRLLYCCEIIRLSGKSYRMENRKTIFSNQQIGIAS